MVKIINCYCYPNLKNSNLSELLGNDIATEISVGTSPTLILDANTDRRIIKIYTAEFSNPAAKLWLRHGSVTAVNNFGFPLLLHRLLVETSQAASALSGFCSSGTAIIRVTEVNKS